MVEKSNEATTQRPEGDRIVDAALVKIDLTSFKEQIRNENAWKDSDRNGITVFKTTACVLCLLHCIEMLK